MAVGTLVSFKIQAIVMTWIVTRKTGLNLRPSMSRILKMILATILMGGVCFGVDRVIGWNESARWIVGARLMTMMFVGAGIYLVCVLMLKLPIESMFRRRAR